MKKILLDTNVLVSLLTDRNAEQQDQAAALFEAAASRELELILHQVVITEMVYVLRNLYQVDAGESAALLEDLLVSPGVRTFDPIRWTQLLKIWPKTIPDLADAVLAQAAQIEQMASVATFDQRFIRRLKSLGLRSYWEEALS